MIEKYFTCFDDAPNVIIGDEFGTTTIFIDYIDKDSSYFLCFCCSNGRGRTTVILSYQ